MSEPFATPPTGDVPPVEGGEMLQFDRAEFATPAAEVPSCSVCRRPIPEDYYEINGRVMCPTCRHGVEAAFRGGSRLGRFVKATALGLVAALAGAVLYYAFVRTTHWNLSLISILLGFLVGGAVRKGTGNRGGRPYQLLAVFLTYTSIGGMLAPFALEGLADRARAERAAGPAPAKSGPDGAKAEPARPDAAKAEAADAPADPAPAGPARPAVILVLMVFIAALFYSLPVFFSIEDPISGLIFAFALWEAWKINRPLRLAFNGPFRLGAAGPAEAGPEEVIDES